MSTKKRPNTIVLSVRCDLRDLAVIALWLNEQGQLPDTIGTLGRTTIQLFSDMLRRKHPDYQRMTTADALNRLSQMGLRRGERNTNTLIQRLQLEDVVLEAQPSKIVMPADRLSGIAEDVVHRQQNPAYSKDEMDEITKKLGDTLNDEDTDTTNGTP